MGTILHFDCSMGAAGDMLSAALADLSVDPDCVVARLNAIGVPGVRYSLETVTRCGVSARRMAVKVHGEEEGHCRNDDHHHGHGHGGHHHHHATLADVFGIIGQLSLPGAVAEEVRGIYRLLGEAEAAVHGASADTVHFHEVGMLDAIADIAAVALLISELGPGRITATPVNLGSGSVACAHGVLPVPAPCTARLLEGIPSFGDASIDGELCTPTGAAILRHYAESFGAMPLMAVRRTGHGAGGRDFPKANIVRAFLGDADTSMRDEVCEFRCAIDDMTAEEFAFAAERILGDGALDVCMIPALMKKGRPGTVLEVLCAADMRDAVAGSIFRNTTTIGLRERIVGRRILERREETVETPLGAVRRKVSTGDGVVRTKIEYDDAARLARGNGGE